MKFRNLIILFFTITLCSCSDDQPKEHLHKKHLGIYIDHGMRKGIDYMDPTGNKYNYRSITTTITNDSLIPIQIIISFAKEYDYPCPYNGQKYKVFLLPETMTAEKQYNGGMGKELRAFLDSELEAPITLNKIINPKEEYDITIGVLTDIKYLDPGQLALISKQHKPHFFAHDSLINQSISKNKSLNLSLGLDFFQFFKTDPHDCYSVIPCGQISFSK